VRSHTQNQGQDLAIAMEIANVTLRLLAFSQVFLFLCLIVLSDNPRRVRLFGVSLMVAILFYFLRPLLPLYLGIQPLVLTELLPSLVPSLTFIFVWTVFEDGAKIPAWAWISLGADVVLSAWVVSLPTANESLQIGSQIIKTFMAAAAMYVVWHGREYDLNEMRSKVRIWFVGALALTVLAVAIKEFFYIFSFAEPTRILGIGWMFMLSIIGNIAFIKLNPNTTLLQASVALKSPEELGDPLISNLLQRMQAERLYADHDLRVATLAALLGVPEYQLRAKINQQLGYQNFNQFINHYRIEEAGQRLLQDSRTPVLSIALDVGFRSISSFNTAFQKKYGVSPTVYRGQVLSKS
jgi:AraC-like DNA-binding protein